MFKRGAQGLPLSVQHRLGLANSGHAGPLPWELDSDSEVDDEYLDEGESEDEDEDVDPEQVAAFEREVEALLARLLPNARTAWRPPLLPSRPSQSYVFVRCPVEHCFCNCLVDMDKGVRALGQTLTAAGWAAADLPAGPVRDVLTRPCPSATAGRATKPASGKGRGRSSSKGRKGGGGSKGAAGGAVEGREYVSWTDLPRYAQMAIHNKGRWCWFSGGGDAEGGAYGSLCAHLVWEHEDVGPELLRRLMVPGGQEQAAYKGTPPANWWGTSYTMETLVAPDHPRVLEFAEELERLVDENWLWTAERKWSDDGAIVFGRNNDVQLRCPCKSCDVVTLIRMEQAYDSFKVALRAAVKADEMPWGPLRDAMVNEEGVRGKTCYHGWRNLPRHAQLGFIRAARWRWFDENGFARDPYHGLRDHIRREHAADAEADQLKTMLLDRRGEEVEDAPENPARRKGRELMEFLDAQLEALSKRRRTDPLPAWLAPVAVAGGMGAADTAAAKPARGRGAAGRPAASGRRR
ncbi:hypothetical protein HYH02_009476 [Chlamydomonas schloesseri]|uniref:Uncharacterized protein n=1 Tax=Chlamydomonas schloesseri TaxID=2026947 RepID=A0A835TPR6_9CHLO|nr:hypothetical protein HYH02_009476 [Chlamydomonas schloesseri]|eukprot:KAG2443061.1 hypothetical protein HYH02_009476 [Chlamydomonas schloesseri]